MLLLGVLLITLLRSRSRGIRLADTMTVDLEHERNLAVENQAKLERSEHALALEKASVDRKVIERTRELNEAHAQLKASLRGLPFGFAIINDGHKVVFSNHSLSSIVAQNASPVATNAQVTLEQLSAAFKGVFDVNDRLHQAETSLKLVKQDCMLGAKYLEVFFVPIISAAEPKSPAAAKAIGSVIVVEDVTEEKALQRSRDEFFSIASHELRTPLTVMRGNTALILE